MKLIAPTLVAIAAVAACAPNFSESPTVASAASSSDARQCLHVPSVNRFKAVDRDTVNVRVGGGDVYRLELMSDCRDIDWNLRVALRNRGGGSFACSPLGLEIISPTTLSPDVCPVTSMHKLSDTEVAALAPGERP